MRVIVRYETTSEALKVERQLRARGRNVMVGVDRSPYDGSRVVALYELDSAAK